MMTRTAFSSMTEKPVLKIRGDETHIFDDRLAIEEPLEIRLDYPNNTASIDLGAKAREQKSVSITMRTPGNDNELALGFLFTEGLLEHADQVSSVAHCGPALSYLGHSNVMKVVLEGSGFSESQLKSLERNFYTTSSCGVCGKSSIDALKTQNKFTASLNRQSGPTVSKKVLIALPDTLRKAQAVFESTGGLHASGLFSAEGELLSLREDVGRHNALDKVIGDAFLRRQLPLENVVLMLSGRISFELVQKASMAGIRFIAAVGAPSSLAVELAKETDMTLVGFLRGDNFNVYSGDWRLK